MTSNKYEFEIAFSFLKEDEALAIELADCLRDRYPVFIYSEHQIELAGKDGEMFLKSMFGEKSRIVVLLHRQAWGTTAWTRIEENAIRDRAYDHGYDFCLMIPLDDPPKKPEWIPKNRIWLGLKKYGIENTAAIVEARLVEQDGEQKIETVEGKALRLKRQIADAEKVKSFLNSDKAIKPSDEEANALYGALQQAAEKMDCQEIRLRALRDRHGVTINSFHHRLVVSWYRTYANSLDTSGLYVRLQVQDIDVHHEVKYDTLKEYCFDFHADANGRSGWRSRNGDRRFVFTNEISGWAIQLLMEAAAKDKLRKLANPLNT